MNEPVEIAPASPPTVSRARIRIAWIIAAIADGLQIGFFPLFVEGFASPLNDAVDVVTGIVLVSLLGWHWAFLPGFFAELVPFFDLVPTWSAAVLIASRRHTPA